MTQTINVPGIGPLAFPDSMSDADMSAAIQKNFPEIHGAASPHPNDSPFVGGLKDFLNETGRVAAKTVTALPNMAGDFGVGLRNLAGKVTGTQSDYPYPSDITNQAIDQAMPPPTSRAGKWSEGLSTLIASLGIPGPKGVGINDATALAPLGADQIKAATLLNSQRAGYQVPPSMTNAPPLASRLAEGLGGKQQTALAAVDQNQGVTNALASRGVGMGENTPITKEGLAQVRKEAIENGYAPVRSVGEVPVDQQHLNLVREIGAGQRGAANVATQFASPEISGLAEAMMPVGVKQDALLNNKPKAYDATDIVDAISALRAKADDAFAQGKNSVGAAYRKAATGFESLIDRHLQSQGEDGADTLAKFRAARVQIAKTHNIESALNESTGNVSAIKLAQQLRSGTPLSGDLRSAAQFGQAFPGAAKESAGVAPEVSPLDLWGSIAAAPSSGGVSLTIPAARVALRKYALSQKGQQALLQPPGKTLSPSALDAAFGNPTAFTTLYNNLVR